MSKLFDNMAKLKFVDDADGNPTKEAVGMYSKEGEYVDFDKPCDCSGQVKNLELIFLSAVFLFLSLYVILFEEDSQSCLKSHAPMVFL